MVKTPQVLLRLFGVAICAGLLSGCSVTDYPALPDLSRMKKKVLTPQEQEQEMRDLAQQQKAREKEAIRAIEGGR